MTTNNIKGHVQCENRNITENSPNITNTEPVYDELDKVITHIDIIKALKLLSPIYFEKKVDYLIV